MRPHTDRGWGQLPGDGPTDAAGPAAEERGDTSGGAAWRDSPAQLRAPLKADVPGQVVQPREDDLDAQDAPRDPVKTFASDAAVGQMHQPFAAPEEEEPGMLLDQDLELHSLVVSGEGKQQLEGVKRLLEASANPNACFHFQMSGRSANRAATALGGSKQFYGSSLAVAAMRTDPALVDCLVKGRAELESTFKFQAGLRNVIAEQTVIFGAVAKCNNEIVSKLVQLKAALNAVGKIDGAPNNSLLWQSCYFGNAKFVKYLLSKSHEHLDYAAYSQDEVGVSHTPLHIVARRGNVAVALELIAAGAVIDAANEADETPLTDAIDHDHPDIVRVLVSSTADVLSKRAMGKLFKEKNSMVSITAAAEGLRRAGEEYIKENLTMKHVTRFLKMPGDAAMHIIHITFMPRFLNYSDGNKRKVHTTAYIPYNSFNVAVGPGYEALPDWSNYLRRKASMTAIESDTFAAVPSLRRRQKPKTLDAKFYEELLPKQADQAFSSKLAVQVPIDVYQCTVKGIHRNVDILHAIATSSNLHIFSELGCQAIVELGWLRIRRYYILNLAVNTAFALHFLQIVADLNGFLPVLPGFSSTKHAFLVLFWLYELAKEFLQLLGFWLMGKLRAYLNFSNFVDLARLSITGGVVYMLCFKWDAFAPEAENVAPRVFLSVVCFFRWMKVLNNLNGFSVFGPSILPIQHGAREMYTFVAVVLFPTIGCIHAYFAFGLYKDDLLRTIDIIYRLAFTGEHDLLEMENVEEYDRASSWRVWVRIFMLFVSFFVGLTMMNIFIAVVGETYNAASQQKMQIFWQNKADIVFGESAILAARRSIFACSNRVRSVLAGHGEEGGPGFDYVWFVKPKDEALSAADGAIDDIADLQRPLTLQDVEDVNGRLQKMEEKIRKIATSNVLPRRADAPDEPPSVLSEHGSHSPPHFDLEELKLRARTTLSLGAALYAAAPPTRSLTDDNFSISGGLPHLSTTF